MRWQIRILSSRMMIAATTCLILFMLFHSKSLKRGGTEETEEGEDKASFDIDPQSSAYSFPLCFRGVFLYSPQALRRRKHFRMNRRRERVQAMNQRARRCVQ